MSPCSARPLPSASPSGLRWEVMRKFLPERIRSATSCASVSIVVVVVVLFSFKWDARALGGVLFALDIREQILHPSGAHPRLVVLELELRRVAQPDSLSEEVPDL